VCNLTSWQHRCTSTAHHLVQQQVTGNAQCKKLTQFEASFCRSQFPPAALSVKDSSSEKYKAQRQILFVARKLDSQMGQRRSFDAKLILILCQEQQSMLKNPHFSRRFLRHHNSVADFISSGVAEYYIAMSLCGATIWCKGVWAQLAGRRRRR
jgi:hypothetical protein